MGFPVQYPNGPGMADNGMEFMKGGKVVSYKQVVFVLALIACCLVPTVSAATPDLYIEGERISLQVPLLIKEGRVQVPLVEITDFYGVPLSWYMERGQVHGWIDGKSFSISKPTVMDGYLMVGLEFLEKQLSLEGFWDQRNNLVDIERPRRDWPTTREIVLSMKTDKDSYRVGETIAISLLAFNASQQKAELEFNTSQRFEITLKRGTRVVWRYSDDRAFLQVFQYEKLDPLQWLNYVIAIPTDELGYLASGNYTLEAELKTYPRVKIFDPIIIRIQR